MALSLMNVPDIFQRKINDGLKEIPFPWVYINDFALFQKTLGENFLYF